MKKIFIAIIILIAAGVILYLGFLLRSKNTAANPQAGNLPNASGSGSANNPPGGTLPDASFSALVVAADGPVLDYFVDEGKNITAINPDGGIARNLYRGEADVLSSSTVGNLIRASFSVDGKKILALFGDQFASQASVFDIEKTVWQPLPAGTQNPAWGPKGAVLAYFADGILSTFDTEAKNPKPKALLKFRDKDANLEWPSADTIFIKEPATALAQSSLWAFSFKNASLAPLIEDRFGLETEWSAGTPLLGTAFTANGNNQGGALSIVDQNGKTLKNLDFLTLPSKCIFYIEPAMTVVSSTGSSSPASAPPTSSTLLLCAVPRDRRPLDLSELPDAYLKKALFTADDIYSIDPMTGDAKALFSDKTKNLDVSALKIFDGVLYFVNRYDKKLYSLPLAQ
jgi:hypothetical protein